MQKHRLVQEESVFAVRQVAHDLSHPGARWPMANAADLDPTGRNVHDEQDEVANEAKRRYGLDGEEGHRDQAFPVGREERLPRYVSSAEGAGSMPFRPTRA